MLLNLMSAGKAPARKLTQPRILLKADCGQDRGGWTDEAIRDAIDVSLSTLGRVRQLFVEDGLDAALNRRRARNTRSRRLDRAQEAHLVALTCSQPPEGRDRWTLRLLADKMVELEHADSVSHETVRQVLRKTNLSLG